MICPLQFDCPSCTATAGRRCRRPSGHSGPFIGTCGVHDRRLRLADRKALEEYPAGVIAEIGLDSARDWARRLGVDMREDTAA